MAISSCGTVHLSSSKFVRNIIVCDSKSDYTPNWVSYDGKTLETDEKTQIQRVRHKGLLVLPTGSLRAVTRQLLIWDEESRTMCVPERVM